MKVYLASRYSRREELCSYADDLRGLGHEVTSRWLLGNHQIDDAGLSVEASRQERERFALEDYADLVDAHWVICFTESPRSTTSRGGRHVEMGMAIGMLKRVIVVGPAEHVFCCLPQVERFEMWADFLGCLRGEDRVLGLLRGEG